MFFDRIGKNAPSVSSCSLPFDEDAAPIGGVSKIPAASASSESKIGQGIDIGTNPNPTRVSSRAMQRRLMMLGLAVNLAAPTGMLLRADHAQAAEPTSTSGGSTAATTPPVIYAADSKSASSSDQTAFNSGIQQYQQGDYELAVATLKQVNAVNLSAADKKQLSSTLSEAESAAKQRATGRQDLLLGQKAMNAKDYKQAAAHLRAAANNPYADSYTQQTAATSFASANKAAQAAAAPANTPTPAKMSAPAPMPAPAPEPAPANNPAPANMPAPMAPAPAPMAPAPSANEPSGSTAQQALQAAAGYQKIRQQSMVFEAQQLVAKARKENAAKQYTDAFNDYSRAATLDPNNQAAIAGRDALADTLGKSPAPVSSSGQFVSNLKERIQAITYEFQSAIQKANQAIGNNDYAAAHRALDNARVARNTDPTVFTQSQLNNFDTIIANTNADLARAEQTANERKSQQASVNAHTRQTQRAAQAEADKRRTVSGLIQDARQLIEQGKYTEALAVITHIQALDPTNDYASSVRLLIEDKAAIQQQQEYNEEYNRQLTSTLNSTREAEIPYNDIIRYPTNWPDISAMRDQEVKEEQGENSEDAALQAQLDRKLPELKFSANSFSDVINFLRDVTGANIYVDWPALERASISRDAPVTAHLRDVKFSKALQIIFDNVQGEQPDQKLGYTIDEGVITISTRRELNKNVVARRYDINDLLFVPPDYTNVPNLNLSSSQGQSAGGSGGGGGSQSQNIFQNTNNNTNNQQTEQTQRSTSIDSIKNYIINNVDPTSWKDNGGDVGSITSDPLRPVFLISQTAANQRAVQKVLDQLRSSKALQVSIETRFLTVQRNYLEDIGVDANFTFNANGNISKHFSPIVVQQNAVSGNQNFLDANGNSVNSSTGTRSLDWSSEVGNASVPGSIASNIADYPNPLEVSGSYLDNFTASFLIRAVEANQQTTTLTAPRLTLFDGQRALIVVETQQAYVSNLTPIVGTGVGLFQPTVSTTVANGVVLSVLATVSPDRKYVYLDLQPQLARLRALVPFQVQGVVNGNTTSFGGVGVSTNSSIISGTIELPTLDITQVETSCAVPDGATLLLGGQTLSGDSSREQGVPVLSKIPFLKRLFTNRADSQDEQVLLILVKPTILIQQEQEQKQFPLLSSKISGE